MPLALLLIVLEGSCRLQLGRRVSDCLQRRTIWIAEVDFAKETASVLYAGHLSHPLRLLKSNLEDVTTASLMVRRGGAGINTVLIH
jgi:hypothetical protein